MILFSKSHILKRTGVFYPSPRNMPHFCICCKKSQDPKTACSGKVFPLHTESLLNLGRVLFLFFPSYCYRRTMLTSAVISDSLHGVAQILSRTFEFSPYGHKSLFPLIRLYLRLYPVSLLSPSIFLCISEWHCLLKSEQAIGVPAACHLPGSRCHASPRRGREEAFHCCCRWQYGRTSQPVLCHCSGADLPPRDLAGAPL